MTQTALPLAAAFAVVLSGSAAFAGSMPIYFPNLQFAPQASESIVTRDLAPQASVCTQIEKSADLSPEACGTLSAADMAKLKTAQDD